MSGDICTVPSPRTAMTTCNSPVDEIMPKGMTARVPWRLTYDDIGIVNQTLHTSSRGPQRTPIVAASLIAVPVLQPGPMPRSDPSGDPRSVFRGHRAARGPRRGTHRAAPTRRCGRRRRLGDGQLPGHRDHRGHRHPSSMARAYGAPGPSRHRSQSPDYLGPRVIARDKPILGIAAGCSPPSRGRDAAPGQLSLRLSARARVIERSRHALHPITIDTGLPRKAYGCSVAGRLTHHQAVNDPGCSR